MFRATNCIYNILHGNIKITEWRKYVFCGYEEIDCAWIIANTIKAFTPILKGCQQTT